MNKRNSSTPQKISWLANFLPAVRSLSLLLCVALTALAANSLYDFSEHKPRLQIDASVNGLLNQHDEGMLFYKSVLEEFGSESVAVVGLMDPAPFSTERQRQLTELMDAIDQLEGVDHVRCLANAIDPQPVGDELTVGTFLEEREGLDTSPKALHQRALTHPLYANSLVAGDGNGTALLIHFGELTGREFLAAGLDTKIRELANQHWSGDSLLVSGMPIVKAETSRLMLLNIKRNIPAVFLVGLVVFVWVFGSARAAIIPTITIGAASVWTLAIMAATGHSINMVTSIVPVLVTTLGLATAMYVQSEYRASRTERLRGTAAVAHTLDAVLLPITMTCLTTVAGFLALLVSPLRAIGDFAIYSAVGVVATAFSAVVLGSALLSFGLGPAPRRDPELPAIFDWWAGVVYRDKNKIFLAAALFGVLTIVGTLRVRVDFDVIENLSGSPQVLHDTRALNSRFGGATPFYVVINSEQESAFEEPANLKELQGIQAWLEAQPEIGDTNSFADLVQTLYVAFRGPSTSEAELPPKAELVSQLLLLIAPEETESLVSEDRSRTVIAVRARESGTAAFIALMDRLTLELEKLPPHLQARVTGDKILLALAVINIAKGQAQSLSIAFVGIFFMLAAYLRRFRDALLVLVPNVLPVLFFFGLLGLTDTALDQTTALLACIVLGVAVDDTIHCVVRYRRELMLQPSPAEAIAATFRALAPPVTSTTVLLVGGLTVLAFSEMRNLSMFGRLGAVTLAFAWLVDLTLTPALCLLLKDSRDSETAEVDTPEVDTENTVIGAQASSA